MYTTQNHETQIYHQLSKTCPSLVLSQEIFLAGWMSLPVIWLLWDAKCSLPYSTNNGPLHDFYHVCSLCALECQHNMSIMLSMCMPLT